MQKKAAFYEATGIIEYLEARFPETAGLVLSDLPLAAEVRMWDRFFDNYMSYPQGRLVLMAIGRDLTVPSLEQLVAATSPRSKLVDRDIRIDEVT